MESVRQLIKGKCMPVLPYGLETRHLTSFSCKVESLSAVIIGIIRRKTVLTHGSIVCGGMLASVNSLKFGESKKSDLRLHVLDLLEPCIFSVS